jgi:hypothetical protein
MEMVNFVSPPRASVRVFMVQAIGPCTLVVGKSARHLSGREVSTRRSIAVTTEQRLMLSR